LVAKKKTNLTFSEVLGVVSTHRMSTIFVQPKKSVRSMTISVT